MRCLIFGGDGMLGHQLLKSWQGRHEVRTTLRRPLAEYRRYGLFSSQNAYEGIDVRDIGAVERILDDFRPEAVVNAAGIVKQRADAADIAQMNEINGVFPHRLQGLCKSAGIRMVHISTDCVFNGRRGNYTERDTLDAEDEYGKSKARGEVAAAPCVTLRTSIIGLELSRKTGLVEWFLAQRGKIRGFTRAIYTGLTTLELSRVIDHVLRRADSDLCGVWQVASQPIDKCDLLSRLSRNLGRNDVSIEPDGSFHCDRSLDGSAFTARTGYRAPDWDAMLEELADQIYQKGRVQDAA